MYTVQCNYNEPNGLESFWVGPWILRGKRKDAATGRCCNGINLPFFYLFI